MPAALTSPFGAYALPGDLPGDLDEELFADRPGRVGRPARCPLSCWVGPFRAVNTTPDPHTIVPWTHTWIAEIREALPDRYAVLATLAAGAGLRQGEIFGLSPDDIDVHTDTIHVRRQIKLTAGNQAYLALPKGRKTRSVPLPAPVRDAVLAHLVAHPPKTVTLPWDLPDGDPISIRLLITSRESRAVNRHYFNAKIWKPALQAVGIPTTRDNGCHALRHYYASVLLDGGESIKTVSERLGHADPAFTLRTYTPPAPQQRRPHPGHHRRCIPRPTGPSSDPPACHGCATIIKMMFISAAQRHTLPSTTTCRSRQVLPW
jgi:Phage integrase family